VALVGAGEFLPGMDALDRHLLAVIGRTRPRVVILPTASAPDGEAVFRRWAELGAQHFAALGAEVEPVLVRTVEEASDAAALQAVGEADLIYLSGGKPGYLRSVLAGSPLGAALRAANARGAILAGCSAGAMVLAGSQPEFGRLVLPFPLRWAAGLGLAPGIAVLPHYDAWPEPVTALMALQAPRGTVVLGIDEDTAAVGRDGSWQVHGRARVTVWRGRHRDRYRRGDVFQV
jgi:cyanophycinase